MTIVLYIHCKLDPIVMLLNIYIYKYIKEKHRESSNAFL